MRLLASSAHPAGASDDSKPQLPSQEKEYLEKACGFLVHNYQADLKMQDAMQRAHDQAITIPEIRRVIEDCRTLHEEGFTRYQTTTPPASYKKIDANIRGYAKMRSRAFAEMSLGFGSSGLFVPKGGLRLVERGRDHFIESLRLGGLCLRELNKRMAQLEADQAKPSTPKN
jgi:hypothetical protein